MPIVIQCFCQRGKGPRADKTIWAKKPHSLDVVPTHAHESGGHGRQGGQVQGGANTAKASVTGAVKQIDNLTNNGYILSIPTGGLTL